MDQQDRLPFDLWSLTAFLTVCEKGTISSAAASLGLTQPGVSQIVQELERQFGVELFDRRLRPIALTPAGTVLRERATALVTDARNLASTIQKCRDGYLPSVRVGIIYSVERLLSECLIDVLSEVAGRVIVLSGITSAHATALLTRHLDLCIGADDLSSEAGLDRWSILREPYVLIAPRELQLSKLPALVASKPFIRYSLRSRDGMEIEAYLRRTGHDVARGPEFDSPFALTELVAAGRGWAISTPLCLMESAIPLKRLSIRPLPHEEMCRTITLVTRHNELGKVPARAAMACVELARTSCQKTFAGELSWLLHKIQFGARVRPARRARS